MFWPSCHVFVTACYGFVLHLNFRLCHASTTSTCAARMSRKEIKSRAWRLQTKLYFRINRSIKCSLPPEAPAKTFGHCQSRISIDDFSHKSKGNMILTACVARCQARFRNTSKMYGHGSKSGYDMFPDLGYPVFSNIRNKLHSKTCAVSSQRLHPKRTYIESNIQVEVVGMVNGWKWQHVFQRHKLKL